MAVLKLACVASVSVRFRSKERGARLKDRAKNGVSKRAGRGWPRKLRKRLQTNPGILKTAHLACHAWVRAPTFDAVISCHNWPIKCLAFSGAEMNFRGRVCEPKICFFVFCNTWTAFMLKYQWIWTINTSLDICIFNPSNSLQITIWENSASLKKTLPSWAPHDTVQETIAFANKRKSLFISRRHFGE